MFCQTDDFLIALGELLFAGSTVRAEPTVLTMRLLTIIAELLDENRFFGMNPVLVGVQLIEDGPEDGYKVLCHLRKQGTCCTQR